MRVLVDLGETNLKRIDRLAKLKRTSRAALIRTAVTGYLNDNPPEDHGTAFGLWAERGEDGLAYQQRMRDER